VRHDILPRTDQGGVDGGVAAVNFNRQTETLSLAAQERQHDILKLDGLLDLR